MIAFLVIAVVVIVSPGPDFALTVRNTVARGQRAGMSTSAGVVSGQLVWACAAAMETHGVAADALAGRLDGVMSMPRFLREVGGARLVVV